MWHLHPSLWKVSFVSQKTSGPLRPQREQVEKLYILSTSFLPTKNKDQVTIKVVMASQVNKFKAEGVYGIFNSLHKDEAVPPLTEVCSF